MMGIKLTILSWRTPNCIIRRELDRVSNSTTNALKSLLAAHAPEGHIKISGENVQASKNVEKVRSTMAREHDALVEALVAAVGREEALKLGREALFEVGKNLGIETRGRLGVGDSPQDLIRAAKILYRVLGIDFSVEWLGEKKVTLIVNRCALAKEYSELTCLILSATDEGVIRGLEPKTSMTFKERMTSGCINCKADIMFNQKEI